MSLMYGIDSAYYLTLFLSPHISTQDNATYLPQYFKRYFATGGIPVLLFNLLTIAGAIVNIRSLANAPVALFDSSRALDFSTTYLYLGLGFTIAHFAFAPFVVPLLKEIANDAAKEGKGKSEKTLRRWLRLHKIRMVVADLPAWLCFVIAICGLPSTSFGTS